MQRFLLATVGIILVGSAVVSAQIAEEALPVEETDVTSTNLPNRSEDLEKVTKIKERTNLPDTEATLEYLRQSTEQVHTDQLTTIIRLLQKIEKNTR